MEGHSHQIHTPYSPGWATSGIAPYSVFGDTYQSVAKLSPTWGQLTLMCLVCLLLYNNLESYDNLEFQVVVRNLEIDEQSVNPANIALWSSKTYAITSSHHKWVKYQRRTAIWSLEAFISRKRHCCGSSVCGGQRQQAEKTSLFVAIYCSIGPVFSSLVDQLETIKYLSSNMKHGKPKYPVPCDIYCRFVHDELWQPCVPQRAGFLLLGCSHQCWKTSQLTRSALTRKPRRRVTGLHVWDMYLISFNYHFSFLLYHTRWKASNIPRAVLQYSKLL